MNREELRQIFEASDWTLKEAAEATGTSFSNLSYYLSGRHSISDAYVARAKPIYLRRIRERKQAIEEAEKVAAN